MPELRFRIDGKPQKEKAPLIYGQRENHTHLYGPKHQIGTPHIHYQCPADIENAYATLTLHRKMAHLNKKHKCVHVNILISTDSTRYHIDFHFLCYLNGVRDTEVLIGRVAATNFSQ